VSVTSGCSRARHLALSSGLCLRLRARPSSPPNPPPLPARRVRIGHRPTQTSTVGSHPACSTYPSRHPLPLVLKAFSPKSRVLPPHCSASQLPCPSQPARVRPPDPAESAVAAVDWRGRCGAGALGAGAGCGSRRGSADLGARGTRPGRRRRSL
jgi:hypothetical protein